MYTYKYEVLIFYKNIFYVKERSDNGIYNFYLIYTILYLFLSDMIRYHIYPFKSLDSFFTLLNNL